MSFLQLSSTLNNHCSLASASEIWTNKDVGWRSSITFSSAKHAYAPETREAWEHTGGLGAKQHLQEQFEYSRSLPGMAGNSVESLCIIMPRTESAWESQEQLAPPGAEPRLLKLLGMAWSGEGEIVNQFDKFIYQQFIHNL